MNAPEIVVVGSVNLDLSVTVERFPLPGETVAGTGLLTGGGGKGANQAVAAARLGRRVGLVGAVGNDEFGRSLLAALVEDRIDVDRVRTVDDVATGTALIEVSPDGENRIVVVAGANATVGADRVKEAGSAIDGAAVVMTQFETPAEVVPAVAGRSRRGLFLVNPAPAATAPVDLTGVDLVVPNRSELALLTGSDPDQLDRADRDELVDRALALPGAPRAVIVTLGGDGALVVDSGGQPGAGPAVTEVPALSVAVVDTTAAGDAFCGGLADALAGGASMVDAARWAARVAAVTVTGRGAQASLPTRLQVESAL